MMRHKEGLVCMTGMGWDPEVPGGYQDADIETLELREAAREADERHQEGVRMEKETITLDDQDLTILVEMIQLFQGIELASSLFKPEDRPTTRQVSLKSLEMRLIRMREALQ